MLFCLRFLEFLFLWFLFIILLKFWFGLFKKLVEIEWFIVLRVFFIFVKKVIFLKCGFENIFGFFFFLLNFFELILFIFEFSRLDLFFYLELFLEILLILGNMLDSGFCVLGFVFWFVMYIILEFFCIFVVLVKEWSVCLLLIFLLMWKLLGSLNFCWLFCFCEIFFCILLIFCLVGCVIWEKVVFLMVVVGSFFFDFSFIVKVLIIFLLGGLKLGFDFFCNCCFFFFCMFSSFFLFFFYLFDILFSFFGCFFL